MEDLIGAAEAAAPSAQALTEGFQAGLIGGAIFVFVVTLLPRLKTGAGPERAPTASREPEPVTSTLPTRERW